jgi:murein DD-endopeptidase MepM/ murein hydrolase activator NlpD
MTMRRFHIVLLFLLVVIGIFVASSRLFTERDILVVSRFFIPEETFYKRVYAVEAGDTWGVISEKLELAPAIGTALLSASEGAHSLADLKAGNPIEIRFDKETNELIELRYDIGDEELLIVRRVKIDDQTTTYAGTKEPIVYEITPRVKRGAIVSSLFETGLEVGLPEAVILDMAWIFSWDIDFNTAIRENDSFVVIYEERTRDGVSVKPGRVLAAQFINDSRSYYSFYYVDPDGDGEYRDEQGNELKRQFLKAPLDYRKISSGFTSNRFVEVLNYFGSHRAVDYAASSGTPVSATADGTVIYVGWKGDHGRHIEIRHSNGYVTGYSHLSAYAKGLANGKKIKQNEVIGFVGSSGLSTGPHLHYEMRKNGTLINPLSLDLPPGKPLTEAYQSDFEAKKQELLALLGVSG